MTGTFSGLSPTRWLMIGSAIVPTLIANAFFLPRHLIPADDKAAQKPVTKGGAAATGRLI